MVFNLNSQQKEAQAFVGINSQKTLVHSVDRFKAMVIAGDQTAIEVKQLLATTGHYIGMNSRDPNSVACVIGIWKYYQQDRSMLMKLWPLLVDISSNTAINRHLLEAVWGVELLAVQQGLSLLNSPFREALIGAGSVLLCAELTRHRNVVGIGGEKVNVSGLVLWLKKQKLGSKARIHIS
jgi:hypothetical protein